MDDDTESDFPPPARSRPSLTPSWIMLGFVLGAAFVLLWQQGRKEAAPPPAGPPPPTVKRVVLPPQPLSIIEAVFDTWGSHAQWDDNMTEVAMWNPETRSYSDCYEIRRVGEAVYFRGIPKLTRRAKPPVKDSPLQFTVSEASYQEWMEFSRTERKQ
jgi:hypothetical protein